MRRTLLAALLLARQVTEMTRQPQGLTVEVTRSGCASAPSSLEQAGLLPVPSTKELNA